MVGKPTRKLARKHAGIKHRPEITIVDLKDHVLGRAAAVIAKQLLLGRRITAVRCDELTIAGGQMRSKIRYMMFQRKKKQTNPKLGPFHYRAPSDIFNRVVRGMLPRYTKRGQQALRRLVSYDGIPVNVSRKGARVVIPKALRVNRLRKERPRTILGKMCTHIGWKYHPIIEKLEKVRKEKATRRHERMKPVRAAWKKAKKEALNKMPKKSVAVLKKFCLA